MSQPPSHGRRDYESAQLPDNILLVPAPLDGERLKQIEELANRSVHEHRSTLEGLAT